MTRKELVEYFTGDTGEDEIAKLKACLECDEINQLDNWLAGVINSLYWRPNKLLLVICGPQAIGKTVFIQNLLPNELKMFMSTLPGFIGKDELYNNLILNCDTEGSKDFYKIISDIYLSDCSSFYRKPYSETGEMQKRLASMVTTEQEWKRPQRKTVIVLNLKKIDLPLFFKIDRKKLWQQIYNKYKQ